MATKAVTTHEAHDTDDRMTACGLYWDRLPEEAGHGKATCRRCAKSVASTWRYRGG